MHLRTCRFGTIYSILLLLLCHTHLRRYSVGILLITYINHYVLFRNSPLRTKVASIRPLAIGGKFYLGNFYFPNMSKKSLHASSTMQMKTKERDLGGPKKNSSLSRNVNELERVRNFFVLRAFVFSKLVCPGCCSEAIPIRN